MLRSVYTGHRAKEVLPVTENELRQAVVAQARAWLGRKEADGTFLEILDVYNAIPGVGYRMKATDPWCAAFVSAVGAACGLSGVVLPECSCPRMLALYRRAGRWAGVETEVRAGDLVFYDWDGDGVSDHVGLVEEALADGWRVIEGNRSDAVGRRSLRRGDKALLGFALPDYAGAAGDAAETQTKPVGVSADAALFTLHFHTLRQGAGMGAQAALREEVRAVQRQLWVRGFSLGPCGADGEFGPDTRQAVLAFQRSEKLAADGAVGVLTRARLEGVSP